MKKQIIKNDDVCVEARKTKNKIHIKVEAPTLRGTLDVSLKRDAVDPFGSCAMVDKTGEVASLEATQLKKSSENHILEIDVWLPAISEKFHFAALI